MGLNTSPAAQKIPAYKEEENERREPHAHVLAGRN